MSQQIHIPVMLSEVLEVLSNHSIDETNCRYFDGTFGRGGHLQALLEKNKNLKVIAMDQDLEAIQYGENKFKNLIESGQLQLIHSNFSNFTAEQFGLFDIMLVDLGVSSPQLDEGRRGFSFYQDGPLDMRMDTTNGPTAADIVALFSEDELNDIFKEYGEIPSPYRVTRALVHDRKEHPFTTTRQLASLIERIDGWRKKGFHPATQYFMALRLQVNQELSVIQKALKPLILGLKPKGRLAVLTFHSLEDRIVKNFFKEQVELGRPLFKKVIQPEWSESKKNSRARSAKLRIFERGEG